MPTGLAAAQGFGQMRPWLGLAELRRNFDALYSQDERAAWLGGSSDGLLPIAALQSGVARQLRGGGRVAIGTESPIVPYGTGLHAELALLADAGIPADQVLRLATAGGAIALGLERELGTIETGKLAKLADGAVTVRCGETIILVTAVSQTKVRPGQTWFPLSVEYKEKATAAGVFPGGYFKREGRPTEKEILTCRMTDRPLRPLFPKGYFYDTQIVALLLAADGENDSDVLAMNGASGAFGVGNSANAVAAHVNTINTN